MKVFFTNDFSKQLKYLPLFKKYCYVKYGNMGDYKTVTYVLIRSHTPQFVYAINCL